MKKNLKKKVICGLGTLAILPTLVTGCASRNYVLKDTELDQTYVITNIDKDYIGIAKEGLSSGYYQTLIGDRCYAIQSGYPCVIGMTIPVETYMTDDELKQEQYDKEDIVDLNTKIKKRYEEDKEHSFSKAKSVLSIYHK